MTKFIARSKHVLVDASLLTLGVLVQSSPASAFDQMRTYLVSTDSSKADHMVADRFEARIVDLRSKLHITAAQSDSWNNFASVMRDNAKMARQTLVARSENAPGMSATDELRSYQTLAQVHLDGLARLIPAFDTLYANLSDHQKRTADALFAHDGTHGQHSHS